MAAAVAVYANTTKSLEAAREVLVEAAAVVVLPAGSPARSPSAADVAVDLELSHGWLASCLEAEEEAAVAVDPYCLQVATQLEPVVWEIAASD